MVAAHRFTSDNVRRDINYGTNESQTLGNQL